MALITAQRSVSARRPSRLATLFSAFGVWRQRRHLAELPAHLRDDIGLSDREIAQEARRPVWDVPNNWRM